MFYVLHLSNTGTNINLQFFVS